MKQLLLTALVVVQVLIVLAIWLVGLQGPRDPEPFLQFDAATVNRLTVASSEESITLTRQAEEWRLPDGNPADERKIDRVLERLADVQGDWPVASSESTARRFEVTKDAFQKQISVFSDDEVLADVYVGTSPSFRLVHARSVDGGPVYSIEFANHDAGTTPNSWLDKSLLRPEGSIIGLELVDSFVLTKKDDLWTVEDETEVDQSKVGDYVDRFESLSVFELSDIDISETQPTGQIVLTDDEGQYTLTVYFVEASDDWLVRSDREGSLYGLASYVGSEMIKELGDLVSDEDDELSSKDGDVQMTVEEIIDEEE